MQVERLENESSHDKSRTQPHAYQEIEPFQVILKRLLEKHLVAVILEMPRSGHNGSRRPDSFALKKDE